MSIDISYFLPAVNVQELAVIKLFNLRAPQFVWASILIDLVKILPPPYSHLVIQAIILKDLNEYHHM